MTLRRLLLLFGCALAACDLSDLTDGREGGGGTGATGGGGSGGGGASSSTGAGGTGGDGAGGCTPVESPFDWLVSIGNDAPQATRSSDAVDAALSSIRVATDPSNENEFVLAMVTSGGALFPEQPPPTTDLSLILARFDSAGNLLAHHTHAQQPFVTGESVKLVLDDLVVHDGVVVLTGRRGGGTVAFDRANQTVTTLDTSAGTDVFVATFDQAGLALDVAHLESISPTSSMGPHTLLSAGDDLFIAGMAPDAVVGVACGALNTNVNRKHVNLFSVSLVDGVGLGSCAKGRRFSASNGTGLTVTSLEEAAGVLAMSVQFDLPASKKIEFGSEWELAATEGAEYVNDSLVIGFDRTSYGLEWVTLVKTAGSGRDDVSRLKYVAGALWAVGSSTGGSTQNLSIGRLHPMPGVAQKCTADHTTTFTRATVMHLDTSGNCLSAASLGPQSDADHLVSNGAPFILGEGNRESFVDGVDESFSQTIVNNGFLLAPTSANQSLAVSGFMFGGGNTLRVDDAAVLGAQVLVVGSAAEPFLNLLQCGVDPPLDYDFYVGKVSASFTLPPP